MTLASQRTMETLFMCIWVPVSILGVILIAAWHFTRSRELLERWAVEHGFTIIHGEYRYLFLGPFSWSSGRGQTVYNVRVRDDNGRERSGWVRCGSMSFGIISDKTEVIWDDER